MGAEDDFYFINLINGCKKREEVKSAFAFRIGENTCNLHEVKF